MTFWSCQDDILNEKPIANLSAVGVLVNPNGFDTYLIGLHEAAREELAMDDNVYFGTNFSGTDIGSDAGIEHIGFKNYQTYLTPVSTEARMIWDWAYSKMILRANTVITYANKPELQKIWDNDAQKNAVIAEARFFRGYTYNLLANLYGGVPIVDTIYASPKSDFVRATRQQVYQFAKADLEFAARWLPDQVAALKEGRIVKGAAQHLLTELYISLKEYDKAIETSTSLISSGRYKLMTERFGSGKDQPGDVFSDLFLDGNQNRSSGNLETIYVWQFESLTPGGGGTSGGNHTLRNWGPFLTKITDPEGKAIVVSDSLGRGVGRVRGSTYFLYTIWKDNATNDIRNSSHNIRRTFYYNNSGSSYFRKPVEPKTALDDTMRNIYPYPRKIEGKPWNNNNASGRTGKDVIVYRLAETYLLRAEAYLLKGDPAKAAEDINTVRLRAKAKPVASSTVTLDYILDERARELITEEPRRRTLIRMGKLVERVRKYNLLDISRTTIQDYHEFFPIPQTAIDANFTKELVQNPGY
ncbi:RagB/SusD family nutrient uptake outer membrane protein [Larkinella bovis]|uniref:RagB/SusD family nutrient uptake outer membrane protein n=1 Tax=Larkinella bovis TaxID=683041 RepID=A0ABW0IGR4_9BACT